MGNSGCVKYRKWNHALELFRILHELTHAHTEQIWQQCTMTLWQRKQSKVYDSFAQNYKMKVCLHLLPIACIMNTNPEQSFTNRFLQQYTLKGCLHFLPTVVIINTNPEQNCTNNFNSTVQKVKYNHSFITN